MAARWRHLGGSAGDPEHHRSVAGVVSFTILSVQTNGSVAPNWLARIL
jgi:hypothetical protein